MPGAPRVPRGHRPARHAGLDHDRRRQHARGGRPAAGRADPRPADQARPDRRERSDGPVPAALADELNAFRDALPRAPGHAGRPPLQRRPGHPRRLRHAGRHPRRHVAAVTPEAGTSAARFRHWVSCLASAMAAGTARNCLTCSRFRSTLGQSWLGNTIPGTGIRNARRDSVALEEIIMSHWNRRQWLRATGAAAAVMLVAPCALREPGRPRSCGKPR